MKEQNKIFESFTNEKPKSLAVLEFITDHKDIVISQEDLKKAESNGYTKGFNEGIELGVSQGELKANREIDVMTQKILSELDFHLKEITELEKAFSENFFPNILKICCAVLQKSMPFFFQTHGKEEMEKLLHEVIKSLIIKVPIQIKVSEQSYENVVESLQSLIASYPETIDIIKILGVSSGACEVKWEGGSAKWNIESRYQEIDSKLQTYLNSYTKQGEHHG